MAAGKVAALKGLGFSVTTLAMVGLSAAAACTLVPPLGALGNGLVAAGSVAGALGVLAGDFALARHAGWVCFALSVGIGMSPQLASLAPAMLTQVGTVAAVGTAALIGVALMLPSQVFHAWRGPLGSARFRVLVVNLMAGCLPRFWPPTAAIYTLLRWSSLMVWGASALSDVSHFLERANEPNFDPLTHQLMPTATLMATGLGLSNMFRRASFDM